METTAAMRGHPERTMTTGLEKPQQMAIIPTLSPFLWPRLGLVKDMKTANRIRAWHIGKERLNGLRVNWQKSRLKLRRLRWLYLGLHKFMGSLQITPQQTNTKMFRKMVGREQLSAVKNRAEGPRTTE